MNYQRGEPRARRAGRLPRFCISFVCSPVSRVRQTGQQASSLLLAAALAHATPASRTQFICQSPIARLSGVVCLIESGARSARANACAMIHWLSRGCSRLLEDGRWTKAACLKCQQTPARTTPTGSHGLPRAHSRCFEFYSNSRAKWPYKLLAHTVKLTSDFHPSCARCALEIETNRTQTERKPNAGQPPTAAAAGTAQVSVCSTEEFKCDGKCVPKGKCESERVSSNLEFFQRLASLLQVAAILWAHQQPGGEEAARGRLAANLESAGRRWCGAS